MIVLYESLTQCTEECDSSGQPGALQEGSTVHIVNLQHLSELDVHAKSPPTSPPALPRINLTRVQQRVDSNIQARWREIAARGVNVSEEAQQLFDAIRRV